MFGLKPFSEQRHAYNSFNNNESVVKANNNQQICSLHANLSKRCVLVHSGNVPISYEILYLERFRGVAKKVL